MNLINQKKIDWILGYDLFCAALRICSAVWDGGSGAEIISLLNKLIFIKFLIVSSCIIGKASLMCN
jgi:hypothetical protein